MKWPKVIVLLFVLPMQACATKIVEPRLGGAHAPGVAELVDAYDADYATLEIPPLALSYKENLEALGSADKLRRQLEVLSGQDKKLRSLNRATLDICERIELERVVNQIDLGIERARLGLDYLERAETPVSDQGIHAVPLGKRWYRYYLKAWLGAEVVPEELFRFGEAELAAAVSDYQRIQAQMGFAGKHQRFREYLAANPAYRSTDAADITARYLAKQRTVRASLDKLFLGDYQVAPAAIEPSDRGMDFPAPGWYNEGVFYYNVFAESYDLRQMDWLLLHEETPGHHFQLLIQQEKNSCVDNQRDWRDLSAYVEGWAAYVETMGDELGLYRTPAEKLAAVEWNMIRSARVALDIGINYYGWSNEKALAYWQANVLGQDDVAMREINRMRNWPAQVITYKYGADVFLRMKQHYLTSLGEQGDVRKYHDLALSYGAMPLETFEELVKSSSN